MAFLEDFALIGEISLLTNGRHRATLEGKESGVLVGKDMYLFHKNLSLRLKNDFEDHRVDIIWELVRNAERAVSTPEWSVGI